MIEAFRFLPEDRQAAWNAIEAGKAGEAHRIFQHLVSADSADGNALYGLGLAELSRGRPDDALAHLRQADAIIGLGEVGPAIGQAYLQKGDPFRALVTWYEVVEAEPGRWTELQPYIDRALALAKPIGPQSEPGRKELWENYAYLGATVSVYLQATLKDARDGTFNFANLELYEDISSRLQALMDNSLLHFRPEGGSDAEAHRLAAAFTLKRAVEGAVTGLRERDLAGLEAAELQINEALEAFAVAAPNLEIHP